MAFKRIDDNAYGAAEALHAVVSQRVAGNLKQVELDRLRYAATGWDWYDPPIMHGLPAGSSDSLSEPLVLPLLWRKTPNATELTVDIYHTIHEARVKVSVLVLPIPALAGPLAIGTDDTGWVSTTGTRVKSTVSGVDISGMPEWFVILVQWRSEYDTTSREVFDKGAAGELGGANADHDSYKVTLDSGGAWGGSGLSDTVLPYRLEWLTGATSGAASYSPDDREHEVPSPRLAMRFVSATDHLVYFWPPLDATYSYSVLGAAPTKDWIARVPIGYSQLFGIRVEETAVTARPDVIGPFEPGERTSALAQEMLTARARGLFAGHSKIHYMGSAPSYLVEDNDTAFQGIGGSRDKEPVDKLSCQREYTTGYLTLASCPAGGDDQYKDPSAVTRTRTLYQARALLCLYDYTTRYASRRPHDFVLDVRLQSASIDDVTAGVDGDDYNVRVPANSARNPRAYGLDLAGYWLGFSADQIVKAPVQHAGRGAWPLSLIASAQWFLVEPSVKDDTIGPSRQVSLQVKGRASDAMELESLDDYNAHIQLVTWTVTTAPYVPPTLALTDLGVSL